jgi:glycosyltransferase involved in cell wall biosynthesis
MNVLVVYHGGSTAHTRPLYEALAQRAPIRRLTVVAPERVRCDPVYSPSGWLTAQADSSGGYDLVPVPLIDAASYGRGFEAHALGDVLRRTNADVIQVLDEPFSNYLLQVIKLAAVRHRSARVLFYGFENRPLQFGRRARVTWTLAWRRTAGGAAANSEALENLRRVGYPSDRPLERIFWGVPTELFATGQPGFGEKLRTDAEHLVGYVGRLSPEKGLPVLAAAMLRLPSSTHCVLIGTGPSRADLELTATLPDLRGRVHFVDPMTGSELAGALRAFDTLVLPSLTTPRWKEQYGRVLTEAMATGIPVVGSDSGAIPEVIGDAGIVTPEGDPIALAAALESVLFDDATRSKLIARGRSRVEEELSVEVMSHRLASLYERVLGS